jgi:hypothetical protein
MVCSLLLLGLLVSYGPFWMVCSLLLLGLLVSYGPNGPCWLPVDCLVCMTAAKAVSENGCLA